MTPEEQFAEIRASLARQAERHEALAQTVEVLAGMHRDNERLMTQVLESIARLAHVSAIHEQRLGDLEGRQ